MKFLRRKIYYDLKDHLSALEISLILGPRQAGKTTVMLKLADEFHRQGKPYVYFNLDVIEDRQFFKSQHTLLDRVEKTIGKKKAVIFIDEVQRLVNAGLFLKGLYDLKTNYKFIASGSGSLELKADIIEPMTGRKKVFTCLPLSFSEFAGNKLEIEFNKVSSLLATNCYQAERLMEEYLTYGGYPRVVLGQTHQEKIEILSEIYKSYLEKDIQLLLHVEKEQAFQALVKILANQVGNLVNRAELCSTIGVSQKTIEKYLFLLEKTFIIALARPFFKNIRKEITKSPKIYFLDLGLIRLARGVVFSPQRETDGSLFENACFLRLKELELLEPIRFWRSTGGAEVDFVLSSPKTGQLIPVEVKSLLGKKETLGKSLISFIDSYEPKKVYFYTKADQGEFERLGVKIYKTPYYCLPKLD